MDKERNENMNFMYDRLPPSRSGPITHEGLTPEQEWAKIADAAERRKVQNRNAQRKYRHNLKRRVEALERQHNLGAFSTKSSTPSLDPSASATRSESLPPLAESLTQQKGTTAAVEESSISSHTHTLDLMDPALSMESICHTNSMSADWMSHNHFMAGPSSNRSTPIASPTIMHASQSPEYFKKSQCEEDNNRSLMASSMMNLSSLDDYIQHNNSIIEDICNSESISSDDIELSYQQVHAQRVMPQRRITSSDSQPQGRTTLHLAAMKGYIQIVHMLLEKGIDINTRDSQGWTALHLAAETGQQAVVKLLLDRGADFYARI